MADDEFALLVTREQVQQLRDDHEVLASMVRPALRRRIVLYPSQGRAGTGGTGATLIQFTIAEIVCEGDTIQSITGTVTDIGCGATEPTIGDTVDLVDVMNLAVGYPPSLVGRTGVAMKHEQDGPYGAECTYVIWNLEAHYVECS